MTPPMLTNPYWFAAAGTGLHFEELGRTKLTSQSGTITVSGLANKKYLMVLTHAEDNTANAPLGLRLNGDTGENYAVSYSNNGGADSTGISITTAYLSDSLGANDGFAVTNIVNKSDEEKLWTSHAVGRNTAGAGTAPNRWEYIGKHAQTTNPISSVSIQNWSTGSFGIGSEVVVLGADPADTSTTNAWEELASVELTDSNSVLDSGTFTAKKYLWVQAFLNPVSSVNLNQAIRFNNDTDNNYARSTSNNGGTDTTSASVSSMYGATIEGDQPKLIDYFIINKSDKEKLVIRHDNEQSTAGAGTAPTRAETAGKWANTTNQITSTEIFSLNGGTPFASGSHIKVWGFD